MFVVAGLANANILSGALFTVRYASCCGGTNKLLACVARPLHPRPPPQALLKLFPKKALHADEKSILWRFRWALTSEPRALTKFIKCVDWKDVLEAQQVPRVGVGGVHLGGVMLRYCREARLAGRLRGAGREEGRLSTHVQIAVWDGCVDAIGSNVHTGTRT